MIKLKNAKMINAATIEVFSRKQFLEEIACHGPANSLTFIHELKKIILHSVLKAIIAGIPTVRVVFGVLQQVQHIDGSYVRQ